MLAPTQPLPLHQPCPVRLPKDPFQGVLKVEVIAETLQVDIEECIKSLGALDLLEAGALGKEVKRGEALSWEPAKELPSTGEELSVARAARERDQAADGNAESHMDVPY
eukprot:Skav203668  [mRNA]  locus=scaffold3418:68953:73495:+ [translate_table: standard]